jgi:hypothetical protein
MLGLTITSIAFLVLTGALVGLISSYFGVGACFIMVPVIIYFLETYFGTPPNLSPLIAFGTNMAIVVPTALGGALRHRKVLEKKDARFPTKHYLSFGIPVGVGSFLGALCAFIFFTSFRAHAGLILKMIFGILCLLGAYRFMTAKPVPVEKFTDPNPVKYAVLGIFSGMVAHFIGIGGGLIYVPVLNAILGIPIHMAVPISLATMIIGSSVGAISFMILGRIDQMKQPNFYPPFTFGWFNIIAFLSIGAASIISSQIGPYLAHRTPPKKFKILLAILYVYIGIRLIVRGIFQFQGLTPPIP